MTLLELSAQYEKSAQLLRVRLSELRRQKKTAEDRQELFWLDRRMAALSQMLRQTVDLHTPNSRASSGMVFLST